jgi:hypothetical protein
VCPVKGWASTVDVARAFLDGRRIVARAGNVRIEATFCREISAERTRSVLLRPGRPNPGFPEHLANRRHGGRNFSGEDSCCNCALGTRSTGTHSYGCDGLVVNVDSRALAARNRSDPTGDREQCRRAPLVPARDQLRLKLRLRPQTAAWICDVRAAECVAD